nr:hypothetical protein [Tanacetum cinerariifolium]
VNTPRCDEDRLELIELTVFLLPSDEKVKVEVTAVDLQTTVAIKKLNEVTRLQALVDKKKVVVTEATIRDALSLDDVEGVKCLPNEEIFVELARMGYEKPATKLTFYKAFFSSQWKFLIHTILKQVVNLSTHTTKYTSPAQTQKVFANMRRIGKGFSGVKTPHFEGMLVAHEVEEGDVAENIKVVNTGDAAEGDVSAANDEVPTYNQLHLNHLKLNNNHLNLNHTRMLEFLCTFSKKLKRRVKKLKRRNKVKVLKLRRLQKVGTAQRIDTSNDIVMDDVSNQGRMISDMDTDADVVLEEVKDVADNAKEDQDADDESEPTEVQEVVDVVTTTKIITEVVTASSTTITTADAAASTNITAADAQVLATTTAAALTLTTAPRRRTKGVVIKNPKESTTTSIIIYSEVKSKDKGKGILVEEPKTLKKQAQIEQDEKYARELEAELNRTIETIDWDEAIDHVNKKAKEYSAMKRYQVLKRKPHTEAQVRKNIMVYLKNVASFKMDYFKGMSYDDIRPVFEKHFDLNVAFLQKIKEQIKEEESKALKRINETSAEKATKRQKLDEEVEDLKRHIQIMPNEDDDVYT